MSTVVQAVLREKPSSVSLPPGDSCVLVIFGATGDLAHRKLLPALFDLACIGCTNNQFEIVGIGRTPLTTEDFRTRMRQAVSSSGEARDYSDGRWQQFEKRISYFRGDANQQAFYPELAAHLKKMEESGSSPNTLFYVSVAASLAPPIVEGLGSVGLAKKPKGWSRIVLEKPFGHDLASAQELNQIVSKVFDERDVYRIDHYLGKETVQNLLVFRFGNSIFEPVWNRNYIDYVEITAAEKLGVESRAAFYEETGALRDMVANHMLQLLTLTAMEPPVAFDADSVPEEKVQVLRAIRPMSVEEVAKRTVRGQYGPGTIDDKAVPAYRDEPGVSKTSNTETYAALRLSIDNWRWEGVPFYVRAGKRLARHLTEIAVHFKRTPQALFSRTPDEQIEPNVISLRIQPNEGITATFAAKIPGTQMRAASVGMDFSYKNAFGANTPAAYETLLLDAMRGDATLFTRRDEVEAEWKIITPIEEAWAQLPPPKFPNYAAGSDGPEEARNLMACDRHRWRTIHLTEMDL
ncbi:MAG TPA: glucose-6-phosphate dehydrogenase [Terriglobales bacterium]|nr:glucose-6-phosphate dehydrogenase [Terriglobales bacterium]